MPAVVEVVFQNGERRRLTLPAETWMQHAAASVHVDGIQPIVAVTIDPDHVLPDVNRTNNVFKPTATSVH
jgi:hypothetical protein